MSNILHFADTFPAGPTTRRATYPLTVSRRSDRRILEVANRLARAAARRATPVRSSGSRRSPTPARARSRPRSTRPSPTSSAGWATRSAPLTRPARAGPTIGVLTRDNAHAAEVFDALTARDVPVEIVGLSGSGPAARGRRGRRHAPPAARRHRQRRPAHPPHRPALGDRSARPPAAGPAGGCAGGHRHPRGRDARRPADRRSPTASTRPRSRPGRRARLARGRALLTRGTRPVPRCSPPSSARSGPPPASRCSTSSAGSSTSRGSTSSWPPRSRPPLLRAATTSTSSSRRSRSSRPSTARSSLSALLAYLTAEDEFGNGLDLATPTAADSVKLLTVHRAKGLEWHHVFLVGVCETRFPSNRSRTLWTSSPAVLPAPLRGDAARPAPARRATTRPPSTPTAQATRAHDAEEELRLGYVAFTRAAHRLERHVVPLEPARRHPFGPSAYQQVRPRAARGRGASRSTTGCDKPDQGDPNPLRRRRPVASVAGARAGPRGALRLAAAQRRARDADPTAAGRRPRRPRRPRASPTGTPSSTGCVAEARRRPTPGHRGAVADARCRPRR